MLRARRVHGRPGQGGENPLRRQGSMVAGHGKVEKVRCAHDPAGEPVPAAVAARHPVSTVRGARARSGGHRHLPWGGHRGRSQPDVPEARVAQQMGQNSGRHQFTVLWEPEIFFALRLQMLLTHIYIYARQHRILYTILRMCSKHDYITFYNSYLKR